MSVTKLYRDSGTHYFGIRLHTERRALEPRPWFSMQWDGADEGGLECCVRRAAGRSYLLLRIDTQLLRGIGVRRPDWQDLFGELGIDRNLFEDAARVLPQFEIRRQETSAGARASLVIDFGNTSSTVTAVVKPDDGRCEVIPLALADRWEPDLPVEALTKRWVGTQARVERVDTKTIVPSAVLVEQATGAGPEGAYPLVSIGHTALSRGERYAAENGRQLIDAPKRFLFLDQDRAPALMDLARAPVAGWQKRVYYAAALFLRELILASREALNEPSPADKPFYAIEAIHFTVPVTFTSRETAALRAAGELAMEMCDLPQLSSVDILCDEATAVAEFFVRDQLMAELESGRAGHAREAFRTVAQRLGSGADRIGVLVIDVGGGTTDIAHYEYTLAGTGEGEAYTLDANRRLVEGMPFGGNELSHAIVEHLQRELSRSTGTSIDTWFGRRLVDVGEYLCKRGMLGALARQANRFKRLSNDESTLDEPVSVRLDDAFVDAPVSAETDLFEHVDTEDFVRGRLYQDGRLADYRATARSVVDAACSEPRFQRLLQIWRTLIEYSPSSPVVLVSGLSSRLSTIGPALELEHGRERIFSLGRYQLRSRDLLSLEWQSPERLAALSMDKEAVSFGAAYLVAGNRHGRGFRTNVPEHFRPFPRRLRLSGFDCRMNDRDELSGPTPTAVEVPLTWPRGMSDIGVEQAFSRGGAMGGGWTRLGELETRQPPTEPQSLLLRIEPETPCQVELRWEDEDRTDPCPFHFRLSLGLTPSYLQTGVKTTAEIPR